MKFIFRKKLIQSIVAACLCASMAVTSVMAADSSLDTAPENINNIENGGSYFVNGLNNRISPRDMLTEGDYHIYMDKGWILNSRNVGVGAWGTSNVVHKYNGTLRRHYTNLLIYADAEEKFEYEAGREWGTGVVRVSTGDLGKGAMHHFYVFYGW